jgi:hypothetical protein
MASFVKGGPPNASSFKKGHIPSEEHRRKVRRGLRGYNRTRAGKEATARRVAKAVEARKQKMEERRIKLGLSPKEYTNNLRRYWYYLKGLVSKPVPFELWMITNKKLARKAKPNGINRSQATAGTTGEPASPLGT